MKQENLHQYTGTEDEAVCPVCKKEIAKTMMGINSHLKAHVRAGELTEEEKIKVRCSMTGFRYRKEEK